MVLNKGDVLHTIDGATIIVKKQLGEGGQGTVYRVNCEGVDKALKWYSHIGKDPEKFYDNLKHNVEKGRWLE